MCRYESAAREIRDDDELLTFGSRSHDEGRLLVVSECVSSVTFGEMMK